MKTRWPALPWRNEITREAFFHVLTDWEDPAGIAREWVEMCGDGAADQLAKQLRRDVREDYDCVCNDDFASALHQTALRQVDFHQVAERLLCYAPRRAEKRAAAGDDQAEGSA
jgi:hypothetical protein